MATNTQSEEPRPCLWDVLELPGWKGPLLCARNRSPKLSSWLLCPESLLWGCPAPTEATADVRGTGESGNTSYPAGVSVLAETCGLQQERGKTTPVLRHLQPSMEKNRSEVRKVQGSGEGLVMKCMIK